MALRQSLGLRNLLQGIKTNVTPVAPTAGSWNGSFDANVVPWLSTNATLSSAASGQAGNCLKVLNVSGAAVAQAYIAVATRVGQIYKFTGYFKKGDATSGKFLIGTTAAGAGTVHYDSGALTDADWALKTAVFIATTTVTYLVCESTTSSVTYCLFDTLSLASQARSVQDVFNSFDIQFRTGTQPATPQEAPSGTLLCTMKNASAGATFADAVSGALSKPAAETWNGVCGAGGTVGWARISHLDDADGASDIEPRIDFRVSTSGAEMNFTSVAWDNGSTQGITDLPLTEPME